VREKLRVFNDEIWLGVQGWLSKTVKVFEEVGEKAKVKPMYQLCQIRTRVFLSIIMHLVKVWDVSLCKKKKVVAYSLSQLRKRELNYPTHDVELSIIEHEVLSSWT
jgi:hypothetical protein